MRYVKYDMGAYNLHVIKTNQFKTVNMRIMFKRKTKKEEINFRNFLSAILLETTKNYQTRRDIEIKCEDLYALAVRSQSFISGNYSIMSFDSTFLNEKYTEKGMFKQVFEFVLQLILNPDVENGKFNEKSFESVKKSLENVLKSYDEIPDYYTEDKIFKLVGKGTPIELRDEGDLETLNEITPANLYDYYLDFIKKDNIDIFIIGNVDDEYLKKLLRETLPINTLKKPTGTHYIEHDRIRSRARIICESSNYEQSRILIGCKLNNLTDFEKQYVMLFYNYILGGSGDSKLFKTVREKNSLCYNISSRYVSIANLLIIKAGIEAKDYKKTVSLIRKEIKNMEKGNFDENDIEKAKLVLLNSFEELEDSPSGIISMYMLHEYLNKDLVDKRVSQVNKVTKQMVIDVAKKVHIDTIYFLEGGHDDKERTQ